jgi:hypothetical protein
VIGSFVAQLWKLLAPWKVPLACVAVVSTMILAIIAAGRSTKQELAAKYAIRPKTDEHYWKKSLASHRVDRPATLRREEARLPADAAVIGVVVDGKARAYALRSLRQLHQHVVNDVVSGVPLTVAYCDATDCARVYASRERSGPLDIRQAGFRDGDMILLVDGVYYQHSSGKPIEPEPGSRPFPYEDYPWVRTTWKEWAKQHPETDLYAGENR